MAGMAVVVAVVVVGAGFVGAMAAVGSETLAFAGSDGASPGFGSFEFAALISFDIWTASDA